MVVQLAARAPDAPSARSLRAWARAAAARPGGITLRIVGAAEGRRLNAVYRHRDYATNVLSFPYDNAASLCGDIVLCHPVIAHEAGAQGKTLRAHYAHLVVHGVLHLAGLDHGRATAARKMEAAEKRVLAALGFADPYLPPPARRKRR